MPAKPKPKPKSKPRSKAKLKKKQQAPTVKTRSNTEASSTSTTKTTKKRGRALSSSTEESDVAKKTRKRPTKRAWEDSEPSESEEDEDANEDDEDEEDGVDDTEGDGLGLQHIASIPEMLSVQTNSTRNILTIFSDTVKVMFGLGDPIQGRWCSLCMEDPSIKERRATFFVGGNSGCRLHARKHYEEYAKCCKEGNIPINHHAMPRNLFRQMKKLEKGTAREKQLMLDKVVTKSARTKEFRRDDVLASVARFIAISNQNSRVSQLPIMPHSETRPNAKRADLPSAHDVKTYINNQFIGHLDALKASIEAAPGKVSVTEDGWSANTTKAGYQGLTGHWIDVDPTTGKWTFQSEIIGFIGISGNHSGLNLGQYLVGALDWVGILGPKSSKLHTITLDNTSANNTTCETVEAIHNCRLLPAWDAVKNQLLCFEHVGNLAIVDIMSHITKIAAVETTTTIWEFDPTLKDNRLINGSLDVIAAIRTIAIKIQSSSQRIEYFYNLQIKCNITIPLQIPLHSNTRWGSAYQMLVRAFKLRKAIILFLNSADNLYSPITVIRTKNQDAKKIPWSAFILNNSDWDLVLGAINVLADAQALLHHFSSETKPGLWKVLPALEDLQMNWEEKASNSKYARFHAALADSLAKIRKYYSKLDEKPAFVMAIVLHPYFKLEYIKLQWGGPNKQASERANGNPNAKNWQDEARQIVKHYMEEYWRSRATLQPTNLENLDVATARAGLVTKPRKSAFDLHREQLITKDSDEGWAAELRRYLRDIPADVSKDTDVVDWWSEHQKIYPTLARIALDILPAQASSVPCERLFSSAKLIATDKRSRLSPKRFEQLQMLKFAWRPQLSDLAAENSAVVEHFDMEEFSELLEDDVELARWDEEFVWA